MKSPSPLAAELDTLSAFPTDPHLPVTSLYLTLDRARDQQRGYAAVLKGLIKEAEQRAQAAGLPAEARRSLAADWEAVRRAVGEARGFAPKAVAAFSCARRGLWHLVHLPAAGAPRLDFGSRPYLGPLVRLAQEGEPGLVLLVGRDRGRLLRVVQGRAVSEERWEADVPQRVREAGWMSWEEKRIDHHVLDHLHRHLKEAAGRLRARCRADGAGWVAVGGSDEPRALLERHLAREVAAALVGWLDVPVEAPAAEVLARVASLRAEAAAARRQRLFARLEEGAANGWGTLGFADTAAAAGRGAVDTLLIADERVPGWRCRTCGLPFVAGSAGDEARCPGCGGREAAPVGDAYQELIGDALDGGAEVVLAPDGPASWRAAGGVGGLLRF